MAAVAEAVNVVVVVADNGNVEANLGVVVAILLLLWVDLNSIFKRMLCRLLNNMKYNRKVKSGPCLYC